MKDKQIKREERTRRTMLVAGGTFVNVSFQVSLIFVHMKKLKLNEKLNEK